MGVAVLVHAAPGIEWLLLRSAVLEDLDLEIPKPAEELAGSTVLQPHNLVDERIIRPFQWRDLLHGAEDVEIEFARLLQIGHRDADVVDAQHAGKFP